MWALLIACAPPAVVEEPGAADGEAPALLDAHCDPPEDLRPTPTWLVASADMAGIGDGPGLEAVDVDVVGDQVLVVGQGGIYAFDAPRDAAPVLLAQEDGFRRYHRVEALEGGQVVAAHRDRGLHAFRLEDDGFSAVDSVVEAGFEGLAAVGEYLYVTRRDLGLAVGRIGDDSIDDLASVPGIDNGFELAADGDGWLYAADGTLGLVPVDIGDPVAPVVGVPSAVEGTAFDVAVHGEHLYVAAGGSGVLVFSRAEVRAGGASPVAVLETGGNVVAVAADEGILWVADNGSVSSFDLADGGAPVPIGFELAEEFALAVGSAGDRAWVGDWSKVELWATDVEAAAPQIDTPDAFLRLAGGEGAVTIRNRGGGTLHLLGATLPTGEVEVDALAIEPGETTELRVRGAGLGTLCLATDDPDHPTYELELAEAPGDERVGTPAPDFSLPGLDGATYRLSEQLGHPVVLAYFATW